MEGETGLDRARLPDMWGSPLNSLQSSSQHWQAELLEAVHYFLSVLALHGERLRPGLGQCLDCTVRDQPPPTINTGDQPGTSQPPPPPASGTGPGGAGTGGDHHRHQSIQENYLLLQHLSSSSPHPQPWTTLSQAHWQSGADLLVISRPVISGGVFILLVPCIGLLHHQAPLMPVNPGIIKIIHPTTIQVSPTICLSILQETFVGILASGQCEGELYWESSPSSSCPRSTSLSALIADS